MKKKIEHPFQPLCVWCGEENKDHSECVYVYFGNKAGRIIDKQIYKTISTKKEK